MTYKDRSLILIVVSLAAGVALLIYVANFGMLRAEFMHVMILIAGMLAASTISGLTRLFDSSAAERRPAPVTFNESRARQALDDVIDAEYKEVRQADRASGRSWEPTGETLLGQDPTLALAKLRIDIERELRRIAYENDVSVDLRRSSIGSLVRELTKRQILEPRLISALQDVLPVLNEAIHGGEVRQSTAFIVLEIGDDLIQVLKAHKPLKTSFSSASISP